MGISNGTKTTTTSNTVTPVYSGQITGAADALTSAYNGQTGQIASNQNLLNGLLTTAAGNYTGGVTGAAKDYVTSVLGSDYSANPYLQNQIDQTNASVANKVNSSLGTRGLAGGSAAAKILANQLAANESNLRYTDYNNWMNRQQNAAGLASSLAGADTTNLNSLMNLANLSGTYSTDAAKNYASGISSLLGSYTNSNGTNTQQTDGILGGLLGSVLGTVAGKIKF